MILQLPFRLLPVVLSVLIFAAGSADAREIRDLGKIRDAGELRVGVSLFSPWTLEDADGDLVGFEVDVARKVAADMGVEAELKVYSWNELIPALESGKIDLIAAGVAVTPARALKVWFSNPYHESGITLATNTAKTAAVGRLEDLNDPAFRIGAIEGTVSEQLAGRIFEEARLELFQENAQASEALIEGRIDAYLESYPLPQFLALENPGLIDTPLAKPLLATRAAFAVARGNTDLLFYLNAWITARQADTWLPSTETYWFGSLRWREGLEE